MKNINLLKAVQKALNDCKGQWPDISFKSEVSYSWLCKLAASKDKTTYNIGMIERVANQLIKCGRMRPEDCLNTNKNKAA